MPQNDKGLFARRRARFEGQLGRDDIAIIPTAPERQRNCDIDFHYRHDRYFYYLKGCAEPNVFRRHDGRQAIQIVFPTQGS